MRQKKRPILLLTSVLVLLFGLLLFGRIDVRQAVAIAKQRDKQTAAGNILAKFRGNQV